MIFNRNGRWASLVVGEDANKSRKIDLKFENYFYKRKTRKLKNKILKNHFFPMQKIVLKKLSHLKF
jgi:hypothetical protein